MEVLEGLRERARSSRRDKFSDASILTYMDQGNALQHSRRRQEAVADAFLRCRYGDDYQPPDEQEESVSTLISGNVFTDVDSLKTLQQMEVDRQNAQQRPQRPEPPPPVAQPVQVGGVLKVENPRPSLMRRAAITGATLATGAGLLAGGIALNNYMNPDEPVDQNQYDVIGVPWVPNR